LWSMASGENFHSLKLARADDETIELAFVCSGNRLLVASKNVEHKLVIIRGFTYEIIVNALFFQITPKNLQVI
jgi:hypothetical protein